eukprot:529375-Pelagomonas_calceolata.AAC.1
MRYAISQDLPKAPTPMKEVVSPDLPATAKVSNMNLTKRLLKGSKARLVVQALMGSSEAARAVLMWNEGDLAVLSPTLNRALQFSTQDIDPFFCTPDR